MNDDIAIKVEGVSKSFKLPHEKTSSIKTSFLNLLRHKRGYEMQHVLEDISFEIKKGEFFGIVGRNGSGKSTLLKLLSGIYTPDKGTIIVNGSLTPFIELGVGFNPELTGRENVYLNGALLGFSNKDMAAMYDDIVEFAELERFMDQKLKNYSSGMQVRLAFSIAIRANSDILVLDEVLAVGDEAFQAKCFNYFEELKRDKKTVVLVTHDMSAVERFCSRAILISDGRILSMGNPEKVALGYTAQNNNSITNEIVEKNDKKNNVAEIKLLNKNPIIKYGDELELSLNWKRMPKVKNIGVAIYKNSGEYIFGTNTIIEKLNVKKINRLVYKVKAELGNGNYHFVIGFFGDTDREIILFVDDGPVFVVDDGTTSWGGITELEHIWKVEHV